VTASKPKKRSVKAAERRHQNETVMIAKNRDAHRYMTI
jgi:hypothetical protein